MSAFKSSRKEFVRIQEAHQRYLKTYAFFNKGSLVGATSFASFYLYYTFTSRYSESRVAGLTNYH